MRRWTDYKSFFSLRTHSAFIPLLKPQTKRSNLLWMLRRVNRRWVYLQGRESVKGETKPSVLSLSRDGWSLITSTTCSWQPDDRAALIMRIPCGRGAITHSWYNLSPFIKLYKKLWSRLPHLSLSCHLQLLPPLKENMKEGRLWIKDYTHSMRNEHQLVCRHHRN